MERAQQRVDRLASEERVTRQDWNDIVTAQKNADAESAQTMVSLDVLVALLVIVACGAIAAVIFKGKK